jgi:hypothetical protein
VHEKNHQIKTEIERQNESKSQQKSIEETRVARTGGKVLRGLSEERSGGSKTNTTGDRGVDQTNQTWARSRTEESIMEKNQIDEQHRLEEI